LYCVVAILLGAGLARAQSPVGEFTQLDGHLVRGTLGSVTAEGVVLSTDAADLQVPWAKIRSFAVSQIADPDPPAVWLEWIDGSQTVGRDLSSDGQDVAVVLDDGSQLKVPLDLLRRVRFGASGEADEGPWQTLTGAQPDDALVIRRSSGALDQVRGTLQSINETAIRFELNDKQVDAPRNKLEGFALRARENGGSMASAVARLRTRQGGNWLVASFGESEDDLVRITTPAGLPVDLHLAEITELRPIGNEYRLGELELARIRYSPYLAVPLPSDIVTSALGPQLREGGTTLRMVGGGSVEFRLPEGMQTLQATLMPLVEATQNVSELRILVDDQERFQKSIHGGEPSEQIELPLESGKRLTIELGFGSDGDAGDVVFLRDVRVLK
jgi:hypothetical protein